MLWLTTLTMNDLRRPGQVVTEAVSGKEERLISSQLHRGGVGDPPAADNGSLSRRGLMHKHTVTLTNKTQTHTSARKPPHTQTFRLLCLQSLHGQQQALSESVEPLVPVEAAREVNKTSQIYEIL